MAPSAQSNFPNEAEQPGQESRTKLRRHFRHAARFPAYNREISDVTQKRATTGAWSLGRSQPRGTLSM